MSRIFSGCSRLASIKLPRFTRDVRCASVCAATSAVKVTTDGVTTPTSTVGQQLLAGTCKSLSGVELIANFRAVSSAGTLDVEYFR
jgi:hypothetical protein